MNSTTFHTLSLKISRPYAVLISATFPPVSNTLLLLIVPLFLSGRISYFIWLFSFFVLQSSVTETRVFLLLYCSLLSGPHIFVLMDFSVCSPMGFITVRDLKILHLDLPKAFIDQAKVSHIFVTDLSNPTQGQFFH